MKTAGLGYSSFIVLGALGALPANGTASVLALADRLECANVEIRAREVRHLLHRLCARELVVKQEGKRRAAQWRLTERGRKHFRMMREGLERVEARWSGET